MTTRSIGCTSTATTTTMRSKPTFSSGIPRCRRGVLLTGDDLYTEKWWGDDVAAVTEFASALNAPALTVHGTQFCFRKSIETVSTSDV